jgi:hypothetical protein
MKLRDRYIGRGARRRRVRWAVFDGWLVVPDLWENRSRRTTD